MSVDATRRLRVGGGSAVNTERWRRIEALFDQALELSESERSSFLDETCTGDPELRREVEALLASSHDAGPSLRDAVAAEARRLVSDTVTGQVGRRIGPFLRRRKVQSTGRRKR